eukprot:CAMPEP_0114569620 /NCGR_PEP_ID=MMETSP0114-20121206/16730_1 /TAXON_ID=31324 /ORGANISM="Goniomonas sp, Strain m" /LENGTH=111 /DNA_ID=CAMNT_0001756525 /DNA_START=102 /DNA_END=434 /DNA_ORIENTATION=-
MGVAIGFVVPAYPRVKPGTGGRIVRRFIKLMVISVVLNFLAEFHRPPLHLHCPNISSVLARLAVTYVVLASLHYATPQKVQVACVVVYCAVMYGLDVPGCGVGVLTDACNA